MSVTTRRLNAIYRKEWEEQEQGKRPGAPPGSPDSSSSSPTASHAVLRSATGWEKLNQKGETMGWGWIAGIVSDGAGQRGQARDASASLSSDRSNGIGIQAYNFTPL